MPFITAFAAAIVAMLARAVVPLVGRVLVALGLGFASFTGIDLMLGALTKLFKDKLLAMGDLPWNIVGVLGVLQVPYCFNLIVTTLLIRATLNGLTGGSLRKIISK
ncbi:DUF2523 family protein [Cupriavidus sp. D39]|uniref:DUF2523 family protein n=1 Tax=Cupriavidus sp. D39 TaxID=2997877 RepID=UPI00226F1283|nr:DUF2523 family protein [Cupriavidus sp. D39]MCY0852700.1 DUF2523 family protein [Cupriavidus sp. D39]